MQVGVYNADTGKKLHAVQMPVSRISACTFGGPDLSQLFITTIKVTLISCETAKWGI